ncbi:MAG: hypothetical protein A3G18_06025 [Rhodospirillales bacterium RIFCSPLOWO2_12_FULL_58_28]|nr:MAG: hypothetical protein A3H92_06030 [Rhodospirillales bacterium RIFCSPLOWO2_02_FULL_58_16]OHC77259.1 MAG: hypothetical protein A3G18_06025 [Rhodospirillales bacterium RIFCSPLOWO2_12_FULL_58_28]
MADKAQPIIVKKIIKKGGGHSGGAWKIAYADFVTAMMAFFLLLWLLNSVTQEQLEGIADHFAPVSASSQSSGSGGVLGGKVLAVEGQMTASSSQASVTMDLPPPRAGSGGEAGAAADAAVNATEEELKKLEEEQFEEAAQELKDTINNIPSLRQVKESLLIDNTPEGLRIQLVDQKGLAMFPSGSANMYLHTQKLLELVGKVVATMPQKLAISGHTDAVPFVSDTGYSNWELSADRANAARRALLHYGVPFERVGRVVGKAETDPLLKDNPKDPKNRRLSIILLRGTGKGEAAGTQQPEGAAPQAQDPAQSVDKTQPKVEILAPSSPPPPAK